VFIPVITKTLLTPLSYVCAQPSGVVMTTMICLNIQGYLWNGEMMVKEINEDQQLFPSYLSLILFLYYLSLPVVYIPSGAC
jgi:hypothetical protein